MTKKEKTRQFLEDFCIKKWYNDSKQDFIDWDERVLKSRLESSSRIKPQEYRAELGKKQEHNYWIPIGRKTNKLKK